MWVFTVDGFYSAVAHRDQPNTLIVRCRTEFDALGLRNWLRMYYESDVEVQHTPKADYAYRLLVSQAAFGHYLSVRALTIDYPNFKEAIAKRSGTKRARIYADVWLAMLKLQHP